MSVLRAPRRRRLLRPSLPRIGLRVVLALIVALAALVGAYLWLRQSPIVAVSSVEVTGVSGPSAPEIREDLQAAGREMTTLDVREQRLRDAVSAYPVVRKLRVSTVFPHTMRIAVTEEVPVAVVVAAGARTAVDGSGTLLRQGAGGARLPTIALTVPPGGTQLTGIARAEAGLLGAAPYGLLARVASAGEMDGHDLVAVLRTGPVVVFGSDAELARKWASLVAVLRAPSSAAAGYIDVTDPARPAAGTGDDGGPPAAAAPATGGPTPAATGGATPLSTTPSVTVTSPQTPASTGDPAVSSPSGSG